MKGTGEDGVLNTLDHDLGKDESHSIAVRAERMLRVTGDRIYDYSPTEQGKRQYVKGAFQRCNQDVGACLRACRKAIATVESPWAESNYESGRHTEGVPYRQESGANILLLLIRGSCICTTVQLD